MSLIRAIPWRAWDALERVGVASYVRRGYFTVRAAPRGWQYRPRVGDASAELATSTWFEYKRVTQLHGERTVLEALVSDLDPDTVFWDVGANVGIFSCLVADVLPDGAVVGFEPEPANRERLRSNLSRNDFECSWQVSPVALAANDSEGRLALEFDEVYREVGAGHYYLADEEGDLVSCRRADSVIADGLPAPDVVKIDVQGAELEVLRGFGSALEDVDVAYVELHTEKSTRYGTTVEETEQFLRDAGFSVTHLGEPAGYRDGVYHVRAARI